MARLSNDNDTDVAGQLQHTALGGNDDILENRFRNVDFRRQRDPNRSQSVPPTQTHFVPRNSYDELDSYSRFVDQNNLQPTHSNVRGDEMRGQGQLYCPPGFESFGENIDPTRGPVQPLPLPPPRNKPPTSWWNPETHQFEPMSTAPPPPPPWGTDTAFAAHTPQERPREGTQKITKYMNFLKDAHTKGTINEDDVQDQITGTAFVTRQLELVDPTPEQEFILGKCWPFILAWHKKYDKNGVMYKSCQGKPPDGQCKMDHNFPECYTDTHLRNMMMSLDEARAKREEGKSRGKGNDRGNNRQGKNERRQDTGDNGQGGDNVDEEWWKTYCNYCQKKTGHTTKTCPLTVHQPPINRPLTPPLTAPHHPPPDDRYIYIYIFFSK